METGWEECVHERVDYAGVRWGVDIGARASESLRPAGANFERVTV